jgi:hypothetical protein
MKEAVESVVATEGRNPCRTAVKEAGLEASLEAGLAVESVVATEGRNPCRTTVEEAVESVVATEGRNPCRTAVKEAVESVTKGWDSRWCTGVEARAD